MLRGGIVITSALMSVLVLKRKQYLHHKLSLVAIMIGVAIVGYVGTHKQEPVDR